MTIRLSVKERGEDGQEGPKELLLEQDEISIGRESYCAVQLSQPAVSRNHARITRDGNLCFLEDLGSSYGTQVNGHKLPKGEKRLLRNGDVIAIAAYDLTFERVVASGKKGSEPSGEVAREVVKDVMRGLGPGKGKPYFRVMNGPKEGQRIEIPDAKELVFGRDEGVDVLLNDDLISRRHAKVRRDWSGTHVEDLESRNGIRVNKKKVTKRTLKDRDELEIGGIRLLYLDPSEVREAPVVLPAEVDDEATSHEEEPTSAVPSDSEPEPQEEPAQDEAPEEAAQSAEPEEEPEPEADASPEEGANPEDELPPPEGEDAPESGGGLDTRTMLLIGAMGLFGLIALALIVAVLVGA